MDSYFTAEFFKQNRKRLRSLFKGTAPIIITANGLLQKNGDTAFPFRQDSSFWYLTGLDEPDILLVLDKSKEYLIVPKRANIRETFDGQLNSSDLSRRSGISDIIVEKEGWRQLGSRIKRVKHVATIAPAPVFIDQLGLYSNPARTLLVSRLKEENSNLELLDLSPHLRRLRVIKQAVEVDALRMSIDITAKTFRQIARQLQKYNYEYEIEADIIRNFRQAGRQVAYSPIVAVGENACTLHYTANKTKLTSRQLILIDAGAELDHYGADITRTYALSEATKRQREIFNAVKEVHTFALGQLKPGVLLKDYEQNTHDFMGEKLRSLGLIKTIEKDSVRQYFPHASSHFLGLDVHDVGDYERPLETGTVLTVEPGIYISKESIGVRLEDDVLITDSGNEVLSHKLPLEL